MAIGAALGVSDISSGAARGVDAVSEIVRIEFAGDTDR